MMRARVLKARHIWMAAAGLALTGSAAQAGGAKICFEGEKPSSMTKPFRLTKKGGAGSSVSGTGFVEIPWDGNKTKGKGQATYRFRATAPGVYSVWVRAFWANGCGNSVGVSVNGGPVATLGEDGLYNAWHWIGGRVLVRLKPGVNTLALKNTETGPRVDQFFLCQNTEYTPTGVRKVTQ